ncbi:MAG: pyridoxal phosphate-dependent aminotransferase, partial [Bacteroidetes bacterium]|nr:pyridoxal phosphate-dependent aminotransferase [Bacteroidota bacterium]
MPNTTAAFSSSFRLRPTRAAKVSEISEATAASAVAPEDRVNFHIGNPVQDPRLSSALLRVILGLDIRDASLTDDHPESLLRSLEWDDAERPVLDFYTGLVRRSAPYLPRGGFARAHPSALVAAFNDWLLHQQDPLTYDPGTATGRREIILSSGGVVESLRVFFHAMSTFLVELPARVFLHRIQLPSHVTAYEKLQFVQLPDDEHAALGTLQDVLRESAGLPNFLLLGSITTEETRRALRVMSQDHPVFFLEANDAPNHLSLAREAKLVDRVLRFLSPGIFSPRLRNLPIVFVAGNAEYLSLLETLHFQLKGTPSASEVEFLSFALRPDVQGTGEAGNAPALPVEPPLESPGWHQGAESALVRHAVQLEQRLTAVLSPRLDAFSETATVIGERIAAATSRTSAKAHLPVLERFAGFTAGTLLRELVAHPATASRICDLSDDFLMQFLKHHPEYDRAACSVVSGSSRTALGLLGFHCGIDDVICPDLSWTYEHCFPSVSVVPLAPGFDLDPEAVIREVDRKLSHAPAWHNRGAVVLNNPHNATGRIFSIDAVRHLLEQLLSRGIRVIDDLSYQNVVPRDDLPEIPTLRQIATDLVRSGRITSVQADLVITVHSLSKTDCLAGARLSIIEIPQAELCARFRRVNATILPNVGAILLGYLLYRNPREVLRAYWRLRNTLFAERMAAIDTAFHNLPVDRNPFGIEILPPTGSMYPLLLIHNLPPGLSLDWVASGLARQGIGMIPLSAFARTEEGYETGRKAFRLTLGGSDGAEILLGKTRRVLIDLNRLIAEEAAHYSRNTFAIRKGVTPPDDMQRVWSALAEHVVNAVRGAFREGYAGLAPFRHGHTLHMKKGAGAGRFERVLMEEFLPGRLEVYRQRFYDREALAGELIKATRADNGRALASSLDQEFYRDDLTQRSAAFRSRPFDRTVHPTQMYSIRTEAAFDALTRAMRTGAAPSGPMVESTARELVAEFLGTNVAITSSGEGDEVCLDLDAHIAAEQFAALHGADLPHTMLSFWGDWDGSNRPSGQGHRLVTSVLLQNVGRLSQLLRLLAERMPSAHIQPELLAEIERLPGKTARFVRLLNEITTLTDHLEHRYRGILPFHSRPGRVRQLGMALHIARDPVTSLWYHNDRLEHRMLELRARRRDGLEYYFALNKRLRKELHQHIPSLLQSMDDPVLLREVVLYRDLLRRFALTPRIHQNMVTAQDPFAIDTTVFNILEINEIGARYGNPGMVLALQVSMATKPEALIDLDRRIRARREHVLRTTPDVALPPVWLIPLFEEPEAVSAVIPYVNKLWEYALQSRRINQETEDRFDEIISEVFIAGSDLSQHVSQAAGARHYHHAKNDVLQWVAAHGLTGRVRLKLGSGEPMQRQGGYVGEHSGLPAFTHADGASRRFAAHLRASARRSTLYATTPMMGVFSGGDLRTFQSALSEQLRYLPVAEFAQLLYHVRRAQSIHHRDIVRASEELADSRLRSSARGKQALERLTLGASDPAMDHFLDLLTQNFRQILYGRDEDVIGIHILSYFIARATPPLRDRPTVRPVPGGKDQGNRILERIASTIPLSRYGSLLRAIAHNQAQTVVLGVPQLSTGLFRALDAFARHEAVEGDPETYIADRILPSLPVHEILQNLRVYLDVDGKCLRAVESAFPAGNSALLALREDVDAMTRFIPLFQQELLRRHGVDIGDFFDGPTFIPDLLPTLRPDLAVLLQQNLFNTDPEALAAGVRGPAEQRWFAAVSQQLRLPLEIRAWRDQIWELIERPVVQRV